MGTGDPVGGDGWESDRLRLHEHLLPHVHRAVVIRQALAAADALGSGVAGLLDSERIGVVQLDRGGRVLAANGPALGILRRGDGLVDRDGVLDAVPAGGPQPPAAAAGARAARTCGARPRAAAR